jgi:hypothetical protein
VSVIAELSRRNVVRVAALCGLEAGLDDYWRRSGKWPDFCGPVGEDDFECH